MAEYEVVREIQNSCSGNQMRDVFFEEIETDDPEAWVRALLGGERGAVKIPGFDFSNSPLEFTEDRVRGRRIVKAVDSRSAHLRDYDRLLWIELAVARDDLRDCGVDELLLVLERSRVGTYPTRIGVERDNVGVGV